MFAVALRGHRGPACVRIHLDGAGDRPGAARARTRLVRVSSAAAVAYGTLASHEPDRYGPDLATALKNCAVLADRLGRPRTAAEHAHAASDWYDRASERGGPQDEARAAMLLLEARSWLAAGAYPRAGHPAREAQAIYRRLLNTDPERYGGAHRTALGLVELARSGAN